VAGREAEAVEAVWERSWWPFACSACGWEKQSSAGKELLC